MSVVYVSECTIGCTIRRKRLDSKMPGVPDSSSGSQRHTTTSGDLSTLPRTGYTSSARETLQLQQSASKLSRSQPPAEATENTEGTDQSLTSTSQQGNSAKRQSAAGNEEEVLQLVQKYLSPEDQQMLQQQTQQQQPSEENGTPAAATNVHDTGSHSHTNPFPNSRTPQQLDETPAVPVTQQPASISPPCTSAQPVTMPELTTAMFRPSTAGSLALKGLQSPMAAHDHPQHTRTEPRTATTTEHPFATCQPTAALPAAAAAPSVLIRPLSSTVLPAVGTSDAVSSDVLGVLGGWYAMYCPGKEAHLQAALMQYYDPKARFEDNFVQVFGREQIGVQFYGMRRLVKGIDLILEKVEVLSGDEQTTAAPGANSVAGILSTLANKPQTGTYQLRVVSRIAFHLPALIRGPVTSWFLPQAVEAWATDILTVRQADSKIVHHQQRVHNIPVGPWPLRCYLGVSSSLFMMHVLGW